MRMSHKILIIDYEPRSVERLRGFLSKAGYEVEVAADGVAGIQAFEKVRPDVTLIEAMLPKKHGFEVCQELKKTAHGKRTPIIIITSVYKGRKYRNEALHIHGCDDFLEKPIDEERLLTAVRKCLSGSSPEVRSPSPPPKPVVTPAPASVRQPTLSSDATEAEIMERLDSILPGDRSTSPEAPRAPDKVVSFDAERARKRRGDHKPDTSAEPAEARPAHGTSRAGAAGSPQQAAAEPRRAPAAAQPSPGTEARVEPAADPRQEAAPQGGRWLWVVVSLVAVALLIVLLVVYGPL
jgi:DNA-binding response OmpR family regulator